MSGSSHRSDGRRRMIKSVQAHQDEDEAKRKPKRLPAGTGTGLILSKKKERKMVRGGRQFSPAIDSSKQVPSASVGTSLRPGLLSPASTQFSKLIEESERGRAGTTTRTRHEDDVWPAKCCPCYKTCRRRLRPSLLCLS